MRWFFASLDQKRKALENSENLWWKFYRKIEFFNIFFSKFVTKNRDFGSYTIFLQQFFGFGGGGLNFPPPPGYPLAESGSLSTDDINYPVVQMPFMLQNKSSCNTY